MVEPEVPEVESSSDEHNVVESKKLATALLSAILEDMMVMASVAETMMFSPMMFCPRDSKNGPTITEIVEEKGREVKPAPEVIIEDADIKPIY